MSPKVYGNPVRLLDPFGLIKTIIFINIVLVNNLLSDDIEQELNAFIKEFNSISPIKLKTEKSWDTAEEAQVRWAREDAEREDLALNKAEINQGKYWVNGEWIERKDENYEKIGGMWVYKENKTEYAPAKSEGELIDSDNDGYDDYTEHTHGTNPKDNTEIPAIRKGNNRVVFKMDGCKAGFQFPSVSKEVLPIGVMSTGTQLLNANK